mgnify:CR=1 FL=1
MFNIIQENGNLPITRHLSGEMAMVPVSKKLFAKNLERVRVARGLSQKDLAKLVGVDPSQISLYLNAKSGKGVSLVMVDNIAKALGISISALFEEDESKVQRGISQDWRMPSLGREISVSEALQKLNSLGGPIVFKQRSNRKTKANRIKNS